MNFNDSIIQYLKEGLSDSEIISSIYSKYAIVLNKKTVVNKRLMVERMVGHKLKFDISKKIDFKLPNTIKNEFKNHVCEEFTILNLKNEKISYLINLVTRDNVLTEIEKDFLRQKTEELSLPDDLIEKANEYILSKNPYLDNIYSLILSDGLIKKEEILFLLEKTIENGYDEQHVNNRFWKFAINFHLNKLIGIQSFSKLIKIWYTAHKLSFDTICKSDNFFSQFKLFHSNDIKLSIDIALNFFEKKLVDFISNHFKTKDFEINNLYNSIDFKNNELKFVVDKNPKLKSKTNTDLIDIKNSFKSNPMKAYSDYKKLIELNNSNISNKKLKEGFRLLIEDN